MPIIVGYIIAHYLTYLLEVGQQTLIHMSDPFSTGANWLGTGDLAGVATAAPTTRPLLATLKVVAVVVGPRPGRRRRARPGDPPAAEAAPAHRSAAAAGRDGRFTAGGLYLLFAA